MGEGDGDGDGKVPGLTIEKKLELVIEGQVHVPKGMRLPVYPIRSSGGPTSSRPHIIIGLGPTRVKVAIGDPGCRFELRKGKEGLDVLDKGVPFLEDIELVPVVLHSPDQAFINLEPECHLGCLFCSAGDDRALDWPAERWVRLVVERYERGPFGSIAITSGMPRGPKVMVEKMADVVAGLRARLPRIPIGVEPNAISHGALLRLREAGADELKVNVQTATKELFKKVCPELDHDGIMLSLKEGVQTFGRNKVCSNLIIGLGETRDEAVACMEMLAMEGVAVNLRVLRVNQVNKGPLERALGRIGIRDPKVILDLVKAQKGIFERYGLDPTVFRTMCHRCGCCDLTVGLDI